MKTEVLYPIRLPSSPLNPRPYSGMLLRNVVLLLTCRKRCQPDLIPTSNIDTSLLQRYDSFFFKIKAKRCHNSRSIYDIVKNIAFDGKYCDIHPLFNQFKSSFNINVSQNTIKSFWKRLIWRYFFSLLDWRCRFPARRLDIQSAEAHSVQNPTFSFSL